MTDADGGRTMSALARLAVVFRREFSARIRYEGWAIEAGLRPPAYGVLQIVRARGPISQGTLSDQIGIDPGDMVTIIDILENAGYLTRTRDEADGRRRNLSLTPEGAAATERLDAIAAEISGIVLTPLSKRERAVLDRLLFKAAFTRGPEPPAG